MTDTVEDLVALMDVERLELDLFRGTGSGGETSLRIFGGAGAFCGLPNG